MEWTDDSHKQWNSSSRLKLKQNRPIGNWATFMSFEYQVWSNRNLLIYDVAVHTTNLSEIFLLKTKLHWATLLLFKLVIKWCGLMKDASVHTQNLSEIIVLETELHCLFFNVIWFSINESGVCWLMMQQSTQ